MGFVDDIKGSISDWSLYKRIAYQSTGKTLKYFFLLFAILFLIAVTKTGVGLYADLQEFASDFKENVPDFRLQNGEFSFSGEQPYFLEGENDAALIIDTTGETDESVLEEYTDGIYITKEKLYIKQQYEIREINLKDFKSTMIDKEHVVNFLPKLQWFIPVIILIGFVVQVVGKMLSAVFLAIVGMFINNSRKGKLKFGQLWNVAIYALTLPIMLETMVKLVYPQLPYFFLLYYGVAIVYVVKAVNYILDNTQIIVETSQD